MSSKESQLDFFYLLSWQLQRLHNILTGIGTLAMGPAAVVDVAVEGRCMAMPTGQFFTSIRQIEDVQDGGLPCGRLQLFGCSWYSGGRRLSPSKKERHHHTN